MIPSHVSLASLSLNFKTIALFIQESIQVPVEGLITDPAMPAIFCKNQRSRQPCSNPPSVDILQVSRDYPQDQRKIVDDLFTVSSTSKFGDPRGTSYFHFASDKAMRVREGSCS